MTRQQKKGEKYTAGCLFAGIGGFCLGLKRAGVSVLWANENDRYATETYAANHPDIRLIRKDVLDLSVKGDALAPVDILTAGFPCQSFSQAGDRKGFNDERGMLFYEIPRIIREFKDNKPKVLLLENVPFLQNGESGSWFEVVLKEIQKVGYWFDHYNSAVLNTAKVTDIPHRRDRLFMVAMSMDAFDCNDFQFPQEIDKILPLGKIINKQKKLSPDHYMKADNRYCKIIAEQMSKGKSDGVYQLRRSYARENKECPPLTANMGVGGHNVPFVKDRWGIRKLSVEECAKFQGFNSLRFPDAMPNNERYKQIGNAVSVPVAIKLANQCVAALERRSAS